MIYKIGAILCVLTECLGLGRLGRRRVEGALKRRPGVQKRSRACGRIGGFLFSKPVGKTPTARETTSFLLSFYFNISKYNDWRGSQKIREV